MEKEEGQPEVLEFEVDGVLDLHTFQPSEVRELLADYLEACREKGITQVRVIHGKGTGQMRRNVLTSLEKILGVKSFRAAGEEVGGWGATLVDLEPLSR
jgi:DNA-nicking Smr family endonuclease